MSSYTVFVVDDEPSIAETQMLILRRFSYNAIAFTNPLKALEAAGELQPDLLLSDYRMPQMDGVNLADRIQQLCPACKVLMLTGAIGHIGDQGSERFEFLEKPIAPLDLVAKIGAALS